MREILLQQLPPPIETEGELPITLTYQNTIGPLLTGNCSACHGENGVQELNLTTYEAALAGGLSGPGIVPGDPDASLVVIKLTATEPHFAQLTPEQLALVIQWITEGAPEE